MAAVMSPPASNTTSNSSLSSHSPSSPHPSLSQLPPIATSAPPQRRPSSKRTKSSSKQRQSSSSNSAPASAKRTSQYTKDRMSNISTASRTSRTNSNANLRGDASRTHSTVFPLFHSSLPYSLVRDFGYPITDPLHYGPLPEPSGLATPASESNRRLSDPAPTYGDARSTGAFGGWSAIDDFSQLPSRSFADEGESSGEWPRFADHGPPYSEDEDLQSPVISTHGSHRKQQSNVVGMDRTRGRAGSRGMIAGSSTGYEQAPGHRRRKKKDRKRDVQGNGADAGAGRRESRATLPSRSFHQGETYSSSESDTDGDSEATPTTADSPHNITTSLRNTHLSAPSYDDEDEQHRHSMTYTFSIASPDEECHGKAVSLYNFERENDNELPLTEGQIILVSYRLSQGWLVAQDPRTGESGLVPESYVRLFRDLEGWEPDEVGDTVDGDHEDAEVETEDQSIPNEGVPLPPESAHDGEQEPEPETRADREVTASPEDAHDLNDGRESPESVKTPTSAAHKPAVSSTFSTSRDDLEPRKDLLKQEERRGSLDRTASRKGKK